MRRWPEFAVRLPPRLAESVREMDDGRPVAARIREAVVARLRGAPPVRVPPRKEGEPRWRKIGFKWSPRIREAVYAAASEEGVAMSVWVGDAVAARLSPVSQAGGGGGRLPASEEELEAAVMRAAEAAIRPVVADALREALGGPRFIRGVAALLREPPAPAAV